MNMLTFDRIGIILVQLLVGCGHSVEVPRLERLTSSQVFDSEIILVAKVDDIRDRGRLFASGIRMRKNVVSLSQIKVLRGNNSGRSDVLVFTTNPEDPVEREKETGEVPAVGEWRVWFLKMESNHLRAIQDGGVYSFLTASEQSTLELAVAETVPEIVARLVLIPIGNTVQSHFPPLIGRLADLVAVPLIGRARTLLHLEQLLRHGDVRVRTRACEALLYATSLPHYCLDQRNGNMATTGIFADEGLINALSVQKEVFGRLDSVENARSITLQRCLDRVPASFVGPVDSRRDCVRFADAAAASLSPRWLETLARR